MKLAYVSIFDPNDIHAWSGLGVYMLGALQDAGFDVETTGNLSYKPDFTYKTKEIVYARLLNRQYRMLWDSKLLKNFAAQVEHALASSDADIVFSIWANPIAYARTGKPIILWADGTLPGLMEHYPGYQNLPRETIKDGYKAEKLALDKCRLAIYSSDWAANTAINYYNADPAKVKVVPFGANIDANHSVDDIRLNLDHKEYDVCRLLFIGAEWARKGGDIAVDVAARLVECGTPTELHIVGSNPPVELPGFVKRHGFISKSTAEGRQQLDSLFSQAHFFILPTRADCTPVVFPEACSFGLPVMTTNVGGIPTVIRNGKNGYTFPLDAPPEAYVDTIERLWSSRAEYEALALSSFAEYSTRLNWAVAGRRVRELIEVFCV